MKASEPVSQLQERLLRDIEAIIAEQSPSAARKRVVMLSGGTDSVLLLAALRHLWPSAELHAITIAGSSAQDSTRAAAAAAHAGASLQVCAISLRELLDNLPRVAGGGYQKASEAMYHLCFELCFERFPIAGSDVFTGEGADSLYGTWPKIFKRAAEVAQREGCSVDEARSRLKQRFYLERRDQGCKIIFKHLVEKFGGKPILPYTDARLAYITQLPYDVINPDSDKQFVKQAMAQRYAWPASAETARVGMQRGTGLKEDFEAALMQGYPNLGATAQEVITNFCRAA